MRKTRIKGIRWASAATALAISAGLGAAAQAQEEEPETSNVETEDGLVLQGTAPTGEDNAMEDWKAAADLIYLYPDGPDGEALTAYCIDLPTSLSTDRPYVEGDWEESNVPNLESVRWVLLNAYPNAGAEETLNAAGFEGSFSDEEAVMAAFAGVQAAVWHFTDGFELAALDDEPVLDGSDAENEAVRAVYDHLLENAGSVPDPDTFTINLENVEEASYEDGRFGPYVMRSNVGDVELSAEGGNLVDAEGEAVESLSDGGEFYIELDAASESIVIEGLASYDIPVGRVFLASSEEAVRSDRSNHSRAADMETSQKLILAEPRPAEVPARWAFELELPEGAQVPETERLPVTGTSMGFTIGAAALLLTAGVVAMVLMRRRNSGSGDTVWE
ncbi:thioester domain-containing protein [Salininema proteolyticum]|uniref:Thioester domain-containing protein n=1 Tax=Salininema proteolyticum TaxID=1607685 RepID=A0ABV8U3W1_9ACTN